MTTVPIGQKNDEVSALLKELCDCNTIERSREGQPCMLCGKRIISRLEEQWLWKRCRLGHKSND